MKSIEVATWSPKVLTELHQHIGFHPPLTTYWIPYAFSRDQAAHLLIATESGPQFVRANWGRSSQSDRRYLDGHDPLKVQRGLLCATGYVDCVRRIDSVAGRLEEEEWLIRPRQQEWFALGCSWEMGLRREREFAVLTTTPNADVAGQFSRLPMIIPRTRWANWLTQKPEGDLLYPLPRGSLLLSRP